MVRSRRPYWFATLLVILCMVTGPLARGLCMAAMASSAQADSVTAVFADVPICHAGGTLLADSTKPDTPHKPPADCPACPAHVAALASTFPADAGGARVIAVALVLPPRAGIATRTPLHPGGLGSRAPPLLV